MNPIQTTGLMKMEAKIRDMLFRELTETVYTREKCNQGHDFTHIERGLRRRAISWEDIKDDRPEITNDDAFVLDLAIIFHDLDRSSDFRGRDDAAIQKREKFVRKKLLEYKVDGQVIAHVTTLMADIKKRDSEGELALVTVLRDIDKADMGAVGIFRMAMVASDRGYGILTKASAFDYNAKAIEGDENLDGFNEDLKFCEEWWKRGSGWEIRTPCIRRAVRTRFAFMRLFMEHLQSEHEELGMIEE